MAFYIQHKHNQLVFLSDQNSKVSRRILAHVRPLLIEFHHPNRAIGNVHLMNWKKNQKVMTLGDCQAKPSIQGQEGCIYSLSSTTVYNCGVKNANRDVDAPYSLLIGCVVHRHRHWLVEDLLTVLYHKYIK